MVSDESSMSDRGIIEGYSEVYGIVKSPRDFLKRHINCKSVNRDYVQVPYSKKKEIPGKYFSRNILSLQLATKSVFQPSSANAVTTPFGKTCGSVYRISIALPCFHVLLII